VKQTFSVGLLLLFSTLVWNQGATSIAPSGTDEDKPAVMQTLDQFADAGMKTRRRYAIEALFRKLFSYERQLEHYGTCGGSGQLQSSFASDIQNEPAG